ncbi:FAD-dependent oxidoreductase [Hymenobacter psoromatis]|uniref:FAD-dependent oxidoreductase n=1 Tax=Hymenobacter psoromatis TaxID=1484116 RepID=UPI001CBB46E8|nr:FAD-dependent monooxygenase [Hymenobacter psoromatis]
MPVSQPAPPRLHVLIIGGGIGGPALGLFLKKAGISCAVYETHPFTEQVGGGLNVASNGMNVLAELGLADTLLSQGTPARHFIFKSSQGRRLARVRYGDPARYGQPCVSMTRATLFATLTAELRAQGIPVHYQKQLTALTERPTGLTAHFADGTAAEGDLLVGADGLHSRTRQLLLPTGPGPAYVGIIGIGGMPTLAQVPEAGAEDSQNLVYTFGPNGFFGYGGSDAGRLMWWANLPQPRELSPQELRDLDPAAVQQAMLDRYQHYPAPIPALIRRTPLPFSGNVYDVPTLPTWHQGRVALLGDAAHAVSPNAGQGVSQALEDALYLARTLRDCQGDYAWAFRQYERERKPRAEKVVAEGRARAADKELLSPFASALRNLLMALFIPLFGKKSTDWMLSYRLDWASSQYPESPPESFR